MPNLYRIDCVNKTNRTSPHERISHVGGPLPNGGRYKITEDEAIAGILENRWAFYVENPPGHRVEVIVVPRTPIRRAYLKTVADGEPPNNLLAQAECP